ncbi:hypothetical protein V2J09_018231, partial [Rumex salicifolius]
SLTVDKDRKLEHIFLSPSNYFDWYQRFGDVVAFDTTYKVNAHDMSFEIFVGIDNHGSTSKFSGWFTALFQTQYPKCYADFHALYRLDSPEYFESQWCQIVQKYNMQRNKHTVLGFCLSPLIFFIGMTTTGRSKSIYAFIKRFTKEFGRATQYLISKYDIDERILQYYKEIETQKHKVTSNGQEGSVKATSLSIHEDNGQGNVNDAIKATGQILCPPMSKFKG